MKNAFWLPTLKWAVRQCFGVVKGDKINAVIDQLIENELLIDLVLSYLKTMKK